MNTKEISSDPTDQKTHLDIGDGKTVEVKKKKKKGVSELNFYFSLLIT